MGEDSKNEADDGAHAGKTEDYGPNGLAWVGYLDVMKMLFLGCPGYGGANSEVDWN